MAELDSKYDDLPLPWISVSDEEQKMSLLKELEREVPKGHVLHKQKVEAVARREDDDDVLFKLDDDRYAIVHLTYNKETDPQWPHTTLCNWEEFLSIAKREEETL